MTEKIEGAGFLVMLTGVGPFSLIGSASADILIGSLSGAVIFVLSSSDMSAMKKFLLFTVSFLAGVVAAPFTASLISYLSPLGVEANESLGAMVSSATSVRVLMTLSKNPESFLELVKGIGKKDGKSK